MKKSFGTIHYAASFFDRVLAKSARSPSEGAAALCIASDLLKELAALQDQNPLVTLSFATDSLRVYFRGQLQFHIQPRKHRTIIWIPGAYSRDLAREIQIRKDIFAVEGAHISWVFSEDGVKWLMEYLRSRWQPSTASIPQLRKSHTRHIPGEVRQAVLTEFLAAGRWCPGVSGLSKRHKLSDETRIEYDHILPHSIGGSNGYWNVQVLCADCNQKKRATAA